MERVCLVATCSWNIMNMSSTHSHRKSGGKPPSVKTSQGLIAGVAHDVKTKRQHLEEKWRAEYDQKERAGFMRVHRLLERLEKNHLKQKDKVTKAARQDKYTSVLQDIVESQGFGIPLVHKLGDRTLDFMDTFKNQVLDSFNTHFGTAISTFENIGSALTDSVGTVTQVTGRLVWFVPVFAGIVYIGMKGKASIARALLLVLTALLPTVFSQVSKLITAFLDNWSDRGGSNASEPEEEVVAQSGFCINTDSLKKVITSITVTVLGLKGASKVVDMFHNGVGSDLNIMDAVKTASEGAYKANKVSDFVRHALEICEGFMNYLLRVCGSGKKLSIFKSGQKEVDIWVDAVESICSEYQLCDRPMTVESTHLIRKLQREGDALHKQFKNDRNLQGLLVRTLSKLRSLCTINSAALSAAVNARVLPECVMLCGPSGAGKSLFVKEFVTRVLAETLPKERLKALRGKPSAEIYAPGVGDTFDSAYCGQAATILDDFCMPKTPAGDPTDECAKLVRMVNGWALPMNMPDLERKGKEFFYSILVLATTNQYNLGERAATTVYNPEAVTRRIGHGYKVGIKPEFRKPELQGAGRTYAIDALDTGKVFEYMREHKRLPTHAWSFARHDFKTGKTSDDVYDFEEVVEKVIKCIKSNEVAYHDLEEANETTFNEIVAARFPDLVVSQGLRGLPIGVKEVEEINSGPAYDLALEKGLLNGRGISMEHEDNYEVVTECKYFGPIWNRKKHVGRTYIRKKLEESSNLSVEVYHNVEFDEGVTYTQYDAIKRTGEVARSLGGMTAELRQKLHAAVFNENEFLEQNPVLNMVLGIGEYALAGGLIFLCLKLMKAAISTIVRAIFPHEEMESQSMSYADAAELDIKLGANVPTPLYCSVAKNLYSMTWNINPAIKVGQVLFLASRMVLIPTHFFTQMQHYIDEDGTRSQSTVSFRNGTNSSLYAQIPTMDLLKLHRVELSGKDCSLVEFPINMHIADLTKKFVTKDDVDTLKRSRNFSSVLIMAGSGSTPSLTVKQTDTTKHQDHLRVKVNCEYEVKGCWRYQIGTQAGDCGSPLITGPSIKHMQGRCILGFHTGALESGSAAFSSSITSDDISKAIATMERLTGEVVITEKPLPEELVAAETFSVPQVYAGTSMVGICETTKPVNHSLELGYMKSDLYGAWSNPTKKPANPRPISEKFPPAFAKYCGPILLYEETEVKAAMHTVRRIIEAPTGKCSRAILTVEQAIVGLPENKYIGSINRRSGAGWPWRESKTRFFGLEDDFKLDSPECLELMETVGEMVADAKKGIRWTNICQPIIKKEKLPEEKVKAGKVRIVFGTEVTYMLAVRMYFASFVAALSEKRFETGCCLGINPYTEWGDLAKGLLVNGPNIIAGDYKSFDASAQQAIYRWMVELINQWYDDGEENATIRRTLWLDLMHSRHITGDSPCMSNVVQWFKSLPSGHPMTTTANNIYNMVLFIMCYNKMAPPEFVGKFEQFVKGFFFGDDHIVSVKDAAAVFFNQLSITEMMAHYGMTYTTEDKEEAVKPTRTLVECSFLKRGFRMEGVDDTEGRPAYTYAPLAKESILEAPYWIATNSQSRVAASNHIVEANIETMLTELSAHEPSVWDEYYPKVEAAAAAKLQYIPLSNSRDVYQQWFRSSEPTWAKYY